MKIWALGAVVAATVSVVACGNGTTTTTGTGGSVGTGGSTSTTTMTTTHVASSSHASSSGGVTTTGVGGAGGAGGTGGSFACGSVVWDSTNMPCSTCMETNCCNELLTCDTGTSCNAFVTCANACASGDGACVTACETSNATGYTDYKALYSCFTTNCSVTAACGTQICMSGVVVADMACGNCLTTNCCAPWTACSKDQTCATCIGATTAAAIAACKTNTLYSAATTCQDNATCGPLCAGSICDTGLGYSGAPACNYCLGQTDAMNGCCEEADACKADATCLSCITGATSGATCTANTHYTAYQTCFTGKCNTQCGG